MLLVKTVVRPSQIAGVGLFAAEPIADGMMIVRWEDCFVSYFTGEEVKALPPNAYAFIQKYGWRIPDGRWCVSVDNSRFLNHSFTPNVSVATTRECAFVSRALRDIAVGEELTEDYRQFDPDFDQYGLDWK
jgi:uncharacterized protein